MYKDVIDFWIVSIKFIESSISLNWMFNRAIDFSLDALDCKIDADECFFCSFEFRKAQVYVAKRKWMLIKMQISLLTQRFAQMDVAWRKWMYFRSIVCILMQMNVFFLVMNSKRCIHEPYTKHKLCKRTWHLF